MRRVLILAATALAAVPLAGCGTATPTRQASNWASDGCSLDIPSISENPTYAPYDQQFGGRDKGAPVISDSAVTSTTMALKPIAQSIDGLAVQAQRTDDQRTAVFYAKGDPNGQTYSSFYAAGGIVLTVIDNPGESLVDEMSTLSPDAVVPLEIGTAKGILTRDDPVDATNERPRRVTWNLGQTDITLVADRSAPSIVALARDLVC